jgi:hypothetical protein
MFKKNIGLIVITLLICVISISLVFFIRHSNQKKPQSLSSKNQPTLPESQVSSSTSRLDSYRVIHPEITFNQLTEYIKLAEASSSATCEKRADANACFKAIAYLTNNKKMCGEVNNSREQIACSSEILVTKATSSLEQCATLTPDYLRAGCLITMFNLYQNPSDCTTLDTNLLQKTCQDTLIYQTAILKKDPLLCDTIADSFLQNFCSTSVMANLPDTDKDGLSDFEEQKYFTNPQSADTDKDGHSDGDEVKKGYNPCGAGPLPPLATLAEECKKYYNP